MGLETKTGQQLPKTKATALYRSWSSKTHSISRWQWQHFQLSCNFVEIEYIQVMKVQKLQKIANPHQKVEMTCSWLKKLTFYLKNKLKNQSFHKTNITLLGILFTDTMFKALCKH